MSDTPEAQPPIDAYSLLSKPTLALTDAEVELLVADLRKRRFIHLSSGKPDKPAAAAKAKADPLSKEAKAEAKKLATADLMAKLNLGGMKL